MFHAPHNLPNSGMRQYQFMRWLYPQSITILMSQKTYYFKGFTVLDWLSATSLPVRLNTACRPQERNIIYHTEKPSLQQRISRDAWLPVEAEKYGMSRCLNQYAVKTSFAPVACASPLLKGQWLISSLEY